MGILKEFKEFAMRGSVIDLAVGVIIGGAFGKIVASLVADVIMPPIGLLVGGVNFTDLKWQMKLPELIGGVSKPAVTMNYGIFLQTTFDFLIVALVIFLLINGINKINIKREVSTGVSKNTPSNEEVLLTEIRDLLKAQAGETK
jgi:large conductance mechanosensitive channel